MVVRLGALALALTVASGAASAAGVTPAKGGAASAAAPARGGLASSAAAPATPPPPAGAALPADLPAPELPPAEILAFDAAVGQALQRNPQATVALEEIHRAQAIVEEARAPWLPTLTANGTYTRVESDRYLSTGTGTPGTVVVPADQVNANLNLVVPIVVPNRWAPYWHAKDNLQIARLGADDVRRQLALATARTYLALLAQHRVVEVSLRARNAARAHYEFAHQRYAGGVGTRIDEVRAAQEIAADESQLQAAVSQLARLREALGVLAGIDHPIDVTLDVELPAVPAVDESLRDSVSLRSDVRLLRERLRAAQRLEKDSWADYAPTLLASFAPFFQDPPTTTTPRWGFQAQLALSWSIYDGGLRYGLGKERGAVRRQAEANLQGQLRQTLADVRAADEEVRRSTAALAAARAAAKLAGEGLQLTTIAYRAGASTNIEVIDAERAARDAETSVAVAEDAWRQANLDVLIAGGRFPAGR
jgi:outer membrane protein TolC